MKDLSTADALETLADAIYRLMEAGVISKPEARVILQEYGVLPPDGAEERDVSPT